MSLPVPDEATVAAAKGLYGQALVHCNELAAKLPPEPDRAAFALLVASAEKIRMVELGMLSPTPVESLSHEQRSDLFALEWSLRSLAALPAPTDADARALRRGFQQDQLGPALELIEAARGLVLFRDALMTLERGGYLAEVSGQSIKFLDPPGWDGSVDAASRILMEQCQLETVGEPPLELAKLSRHILRTLKAEFPLGLDTAGLPGDVAWRLWEALIRLAHGWKREHLCLRRGPKGFRTSDPKEAVLLRTPGEVVSQLADMAGCTRAEAVRFVERVSFEQATPKKFSLFHKPIIRLNTQTMAIEINCRVPALQVDTLG